MVAEDIPSRSRRASKPEERGKAAAMTRERILEAAVKEFGSKGYSGARTAGIAARAGVNQQLISYYFGGKQGLLDELRRRWVTAQATMTPRDGSFEETVSAYLDATLDRPDWARLVVWQALGDRPDGEDEQPEQRSRLREAVDRVRRRQETGEITDDLDAEFILLVTYAVTFAPIALPQFVEGIFGVDPFSEEFRNRCRDQLFKLAGPRGEAEIGRGERS